MIATIFIYKIDNMMKKCYTNYKMFTSKKDEYYELVI